MMLSRLQKHIPRPLIDELRIRLGRYARTSYSQEGEDMILRRMFEGRKNGFYIDVGSHHPIRLSNTYYFYRRGWFGINIDAMPGSMRLFSRYRPRDINLEIPVAKNTRPLSYYMFSEPALNGFSKDLSEARAREKRGGVELIATVKLSAKPLSDILGQHLPAGQSIDFLSVDVEGYDLEVLESNDWERFRPEVILVEVLDCSLDELQGNALNQFLCNVGYELWGKAVNTVIFRARSA